MTFSSYFRYPHLHEDLLTFVAEDDVWVAPLTGGRAWRISSLQLPVRNPRFSPDGRNLAWSVVQGSAPEAVTAAVDGGWVSVEWEKAWLPGLAEPEEILPDAITKLKEWTKPPETEKPAKPAPAKKEPAAAAAVPAK